MSQIRLKYSDGAEECRKGVTDFSLDPATEDTEATYYITEGEVVMKIPARILSGFRYDA